MEELSSRSEARGLGFRATVDLDPHQRGFAERSIPKPVDQAPAPEKLTQKASLNAVSALLDFGAKTMVGLVLTPLLLHQMGVTLFSVWLVLGRLTNYLTVADGRPTEALKWVVAHHQASKDGAELRRYLASAMGVWLAFFPVLIVAGSVMIWLAPLVAKVPPSLAPIVRLAAAILVADFMVSGLEFLPEAILRGMNLGYKRMGLQAGLHLLGGALTAGAVYAGWNIVGAAAAQFATSVITGFFFLLVVKRYVWWFGLVRPSLSGIRSFFGVSVWYFGWSLTNRLLLSSDLLFLSLLAPTATVAAYALTGYAAQMALTLISLVLGAVTPGLGGIIGKGEWARAARLRREMLIVGWVLATTIGSGILLWNRSFIQLWVGKDQYAGSLVSLLLVAVLVQWIFIRANAYLIDLTLQQRTKVLYGLISFGLSLLLAWLLVPKHGMVGLCIALLASRLLLTVAYPVLLAGYLQGATAGSITFWIRPWLCTVVVLGGSTILGDLLHPNGWVAWTAGVLLGAGVVAPVVIIMGLPRLAAQQLLQRMRGAVRRTSLT